jgi:hypothetical protein
MAIALRHSRLIPSGMSFAAYMAAVGFDSAIDLLDGETDGFAIDATHYDGFEGYAYPAYVGGPVGGTVAVIDTGTPANDLSDVPLDASNLLQSGTSPKMVHFPSSPYVRWSPHNMLFRSQEFDNAFWTDVSISETANDTTAPDGTSTADKLVPAAASAVHYIANGNPNETAIPVGGAVYTASVYAKAAGYNFVLVNFNSDSTDFGVVYDLSDGSFEGNRSGTTPAATTIEDAGNGWWRIGVSGVGTTLGSIAILVGSSASEAINTSSWTANGTDGIHVWGAQINRGYIPTPYLVTTDAARIGIPHSYDTAAAQYGILIEPAATNLALYSDDFTNAAWTKSNMTTAKTATGPDDGTNSASTLTATAGNATALQAITSASAARITSFWVKRRTGSGNIDLTQDNGSTWQTMTVTADWTRVELTAATLANPTVGIRIVTSADAVDVWGFQHEVSSVSTSTIPTLGSTVTRAVDAVSAPATSFNKGTTAASLVLYAKVLDVGGSNFDMVAMSESSSQDKYSLYSLPAFDVAYRVEDDGGVQAETYVGDPHSPTTSPFRAAMRYTANDFNGAFNGNLGGADTSGTMPQEIDLMRFYHNAGQVVSILLFQVIHLPRALSDGELETKST